MLSILIITRLRIADHNYTLLHSEEETAPRLWFYEPSVATLLEDNFDPIRHYGREDTTILVNLLEALKNILFVCDGNKAYVDALYRYVQATVFDAEHNITNPYERKRIDEMLERVNEVAKRRGDDVHLALSPQQQS